MQLGLKPEFDRFLLHNPDGSGEISAVAVGPRGSLYAFHKDGTANGNMGGHKIKVYNRDGKHLKVLAPFPADIDVKRVKALGVFQTSAGDLVPHIYNWETLSFYPDNIGVRGRDMPEWSCPAVDSRGPGLLAGQGAGARRGGCRRRHPLRHIPRSAPLAGRSRTSGWPATIRRSGRSVPAWR